MKTLLGILLLWTSSAFANCGEAIVASDLNLDWDLTWVGKSISVQVSKTDPAACTFGLGFTWGQAGSYTRYAAHAGKQIAYQLYQDTVRTNVLKDIPQAVTTNDVVMVTLPAGSNPQQAYYYFDIPYAAATSPIVAPGAYTDSFFINAYEGSDPSTYVAPPISPTQVNVTINVPYVVALSLVDTGGVFQDGATTKSIDFGTLASNQVARFDLRIRTNAGYAVTFNSANNGRMKHATKNAYIPYTLTLNGAAADLSGASATITSGGQTNLAGVGLPVKIVIGSVAGTSIAGTYRDSVVVTVVATE